MAAKFKKILAWIGVSLVGLVALGLAVRAVFNYTTGRRVDRMLRQMKSEGAPLALRELEPQCPDPDNAALAWKAAEALVQMDPERKALGDAVQDYFSGRLLDAGRGEFAALTVRDCVRRLPAIARSPDFLRLASGPVGQLIAGTEVAS